MDRCNVIMHYYIVGIFHQDKTLIVASITEILSCEFFLCIKDYTVDMATFTVLVKIKIWHTIRG